DTVDEHTPATRLHELRIDAKKLRYLVDVVPSYYDVADLQCILASLKKLQRVLGDFNDAHVQESRLLECRRALSAAGGSAGVLLRLPSATARRRVRQEESRGWSGPRCSHQGDRLQQSVRIAGGFRLPQI